MEYLNAAFVGTVVQGIRLVNVECILPVEITRGEAILVRSLQVKQWGSGWSVKAITLTGSSLDMLVFKPAVIIFV